MADERANANEGADPSAEIKQQNPGGTTTADIAGSGDDAEADAMEEVQEEAAEERENNGGYQ